MVTKYEQTISEVREEALRLRRMCEKGICPWSMFDTYVRAARRRSDSAALGDLVR